MSRRNRKPGDAGDDRARRVKVRDMVVAAAAAAALAAALTAGAVAIDARQTGVQQTCRQVEKLRADLVVVLSTARDTAAAQARALPAGERERRLRMLNEFYGAQIRRVGPVNCP